MNGFEEEKPLGLSSVKIFGDERELYTHGWEWERIARPRMGGAGKDTVFCVHHHVLFVVADLPPEWSQADTVDWSSVRNCRNVKISRAWKQKEDCETILDWGDYLDVVTRCDIVIVGWIISLKKCYWKIVET